MEWHFHYFSFPYQNCLKQLFLIIFQFGNFYKLIIDFGSQHFRNYCWKYYFQMLRGINFFGSLMLLWNEIFYVFAEYHFRELRNSLYFANCSDNINFNTTLFDYLYIYFNYSNSLFISCLFDYLYSLAISPKI